MVRQKKRKNIWVYLEQESGQLLPVFARITEQKDGNWQMK